MWNSKLRSEGEPGTLYLAQYEYGGEQLLNVSRMNLNPSTLPIDVGFSSTMQLTTWKKRVALSLFKGRLSIIRSLQNLRKDQSTNGVCLVVPELLIDQRISL